jgi:hypothetical protein
MRRTWCVSISGHYDELVQGLEQAGSQKSMSRVRWSHAPAVAPKVFSREVLPLPQFRVHQKMSYKNLSSSLSTFFSSGEALVPSPTRRSLLFVANADITHQIGSANVFGQPRQPATDGRQAL